MLDGPIAAINTRPPTARRETSRSSVGCAAAYPAPPVIDRSNDRTSRTDNEGDAASEIAGAAPHIECPLASSGHSMQRRAVPIFGRATPKYQTLASTS